MSQEKSHEDFITWEAHVESEDAATVDTCCFLPFRFHSPSLIFSDRFIHKASWMRLAVRIHGAYKTRVGKCKLIGQIMPSLIFKIKITELQPCYLFISRQWLFLHCNSIVEYLSETVWFTKPHICTTWTFNEKMH